MMKPKATKAAPVSFVDLINKRYETGQGWLVFYEVANGTGYKGTGYCDALALSTWPSRGITLQGFEFKRSRTDLLRDLRSESKSESFVKYCNAWWLVVSDPKLVDGVEIPATWGILAPKNNVLYQVRPAPKLKPEPWKPEFIAAMMRRFYEGHLKKDDVAIQEAVEQRAKILAGQIIAREESAEDQGVQRELARYKHQVDELTLRIAKFELESGLLVNSWNAKNIGDIARYLLNSNNHSTLRRRIQEAYKDATIIAESVKVAMSGLERLEHADSQAEAT